MLYGELVNIYTKEYNQTFESKDKKWRQRYGYQNLKDLDYQLYQSQQPDELIPKWVKVTKSRFDEIKTINTESRKNKLKTIINGKESTLINLEKLVEDIFSGKIKKSETKKRYNIIIDDDMTTIVKSKTRKKRKT